MVMTLDRYSDVALQNGISSSGTGHTLLQREAGPDLTVVIPPCNEVANVDPVVAELLEVLDGMAASSRMTM